MCLYVCCLSGLRGMCLSLLYSYSSVCVCVCAQEIYAKCPNLLKCSSLLNSYAVFLFQFISNEVNQWYMT